MNGLQIFSNPDFGSIRTTMIDCEPWFIAIDVTTALGYSNSRDAIKKHVDDDDKNTVAKRDGIPGNPNLTIINESGLYSLIFSSKLPDAKKFKRWVTSEVLPSIRKTGRYAVPDAAGGTETAQGFISDRQAAGQVSQLIRTLSAVMQRQGQSGRAIAEMAQAVCGQFGIVLPDTFVSATSPPALPAPTQQSADLETVRDFYSGYDKRGVIPACEVYADYRRWMRENRSGEHPAERHYFGRLWCRVSGLQTRPMSCRGMKGRYYRIP